MLRCPVMLDKVVSFIVKCYLCFSLQCFNRWIKLWILTGGVWGGSLLEGEEERAGPDDEEHGQVEDSFLPGHHHSSVAAERVFPRQLLPFSHLSRYHHRRHVVPRSALLFLFIRKLCIILWCCKNGQNSGGASNISEALLWKVSQSHHQRLLIHTLALGCSVRLLILILPPSDHCLGESEEIRRLEPDVSCSNPAAVVVASRDRTLAGWHLYHLYKSQMDARASRSVCAHSTPRARRSVAPRECKK